MPRASIALLTDFGLSGPYVGAMKAVILGINPDAAIFDITHLVGPQAIEEGAFLLSSVIPYLPAGVVVVAVVDPGVGTERPALALQTPRGVFVGPDNGLLSAALSDEQRAQTRGTKPALIDLPAGCQAVQLTESRFFRQPLSTTFHGRDIFAPVGANISAGVPLGEFGPPARQLSVLPPWCAQAEADGSFRGRVIYINHYGNIVSDIRGSDLPSRSLEVEIAGHRFSGLQRSFQDGPEYVVYIGSGGYLEVARRNANAASALGVHPGDTMLALPHAEHE